MSNKLQPALIGGVAWGLLSVLPYVTYVNGFCCTWAILGGAFASYLYVKRSAMPASSGDGAVLGALAGVIGVLIYLVVVLASYAGSRDQAEAQLAELVGQLGRAGVSLSLTGLLSIAITLAAVLMLGAAIIGGILGVSLFEKRKSSLDLPPSSPSPPPPPDFSGQPTPPPPPSYGS